MIKTVIFNLIMSSILLLVFTISIEYEVGGLCNYWRCVDPWFMLIQPLLIFHVLGNIIGIYMNLADNNGS